MSLAECFDVVVYIVYYIVVMEMLRHRSVCTTTSYVHIVYNIGVNYDIVYLYRSTISCRISYTTSGMIWDAIRVITQVLLAHSIIVPGRCHGNAQYLTPVCRTPRSPAPLTPIRTGKAETLGYPRLFSWAVPGPVDRYLARDSWAVPGRARLRRPGVSVAVGLFAPGDSDGPPPGCRRHPVLSVDMHLSAAAAWQCARRDAPVATRPVRRHPS